MAKPNQHSGKYFKRQNGIEKCMARFHSEVKRGNVIGCKGWTAEGVLRTFGRSFYMIPCDAVAKNKDTFGRKIHDYSHPSAT